MVAAVAAAIAAARPPSAKTSLIYKTEDSTAQAKKGGILKDRANGDAPSFSVQEPIAPLNYPAKDVYSTHGAPQGAATCRRRRRSR